MANANVSLMRRHPTRAEALLWHPLRKKRVGGRRFRGSPGFRSSVCGARRNLEGVVRAIELDLSKPEPADPSP